MPRSYLAPQEQDDWQTRIQRDLARIRGEQVPEQDDWQTRIQQDMARIRGETSAPPPVSVPMSPARSDLLNRATAQAFAPEPEPMVDSRGHITLPEETPEQHQARLDSYYSRIKGPIREHWPEMPTPVPGPVPAPKPGLLLRGASKVLGADPRDLQQLGGELMRMEERTPIVNWAFRKAFVPQPEAVPFEALVPEPAETERTRAIMGNALPSPVPVNQGTMGPTEPARRGLRPAPSLLAQPDAAAWAIPEPIPPEGVTPEAREALLQRPDEAGWTPPYRPREPKTDLDYVIEYGIAGGMPGKLGEKTQERIREEGPPHMLTGEGPDVYAVAGAIGRVAGFIPQAAAAGLALARPVGALASKVMGAVISPEGRTLAAKAGGRVIPAIARLAQKFGIPDLVERAALLAPKTTAAVTGAATAVAPALAFGAGMEAIGAVGDIAAGDEPVEAAAAHIRAFVQAAPMYGGLGVLLGGLGGAATMQSLEKGLGEPRKNALDVLGLRYNATTEQISARRRELTKALHPDLGGKTEDMQVVNAAADVALKGAASAPTIEAEVGVSQMHAQPSTQPNIRHEAARRGAPVQEMVPEPVRPVAAAKPAAGIRRRFEIEDEIAARAGEVVLPPLDIPPIPEDQADRIRGTFGIERRAPVQPEPGMGRDWNRRETDIPYPKGMVRPVEAAPVEALPVRDMNIRDDTWAAMEAERADRLAAAPVEAVPETPAKPANRWRPDLEDYEAFDVAPQDIVLDPVNMQYKGSTGWSGRNEALDDVEVWDRNREGIVALWQDPARPRGTLTGVNGHARIEKALELGRPLVRAYEIPAADAPTMGHARLIGALINIGEGSGKPVDAAKIFRETNISSVEDLKKAGVPTTGAVARDGLALSRLSDGLFARVVQGTLTENRAAIIGRGGLTHAEQDGLWEVLKKEEAAGKRLLNDDIEELVRFTKSAPTEEVVRQGVLFGDEVVDQSLVVDKARLSSWVKKELGRRARTFNFNADQWRAAQMSKEGVGEIDTEKAKEIGLEASQAQEVYKRLSASAGPVSEALNRAVIELRAGANQNEVRRGLLENVQGAVREVVGGGAQKGAGIGEEGPGTIGEVRQESEALQRAAIREGEVETGLAQEQEALGTPERIAAAVVRVGNEVASGDSHFQAIQKLMARGIDISEAPDDTPIFVGFRTNTGREITREEGAVVQGIPDAGIYGRRLSAEEVPALREQGFARAEREDPQYAAWANRMRQAGAIKDEGVKFNATLADLRQIIRDGAQGKGLGPVGAGDIDLFGQPVVTGPDQGELLPEPRGIQGMTAALEDARTITSQFENKAARGALSDTDLRRYNDARSLIRRSEGRGLDTEEVQARIEPTAADEHTADLFGESSPQVALEHLANVFGSVENASAVKQALVADVGMDLVEISVPGVLPRGAREQAVQEGVDAAYVWTQADGHTLVGEMVEVSGRRQDVDSDKMYRLLRAFRHPEAEYTHTIEAGPVVDGVREVLHHSWVTSGAVDQSYLDGLSVAQAMARTKKAGGQLYMAHNHPSGVPAPSEADLKTANTLFVRAADMGVDFAGHYIINGETAVLLTPKNLAVVHQIYRDAVAANVRLDIDALVAAHGVRLPAGEWQGDWTNRNTLRITDSTDAYKVLKALPSGAGRMDVMMTDVALQVVAIEPMTIEALDNIEEWLPGLMRANAAIGFSLGVHGAEAYDRAVGAMKGTAFNVLEVIDTENRKAAGAAGLLPAPMGMSMVQGVREEANLPTLGRADRGEVRQDPDQFRLSFEEFENPGEGRRRHDITSAEGWQDHLIEGDLPSVNRPPIGPKPSPFMAPVRHAIAAYTFYSESMIEVVKRQGGRVGKALAARAELVNSDTKKLLGKWDAARTAAQKLVAVGPKAQKVVNWLQAEVQREGQHPDAVYRRIQGAMEGRIADADMPPRVLREVQALRNLNDVTGQEFERIGLLQIKKEVQEDPQLRAELEKVLAGEGDENLVFRQFTRTPDGKIFLRMMTPQMQQIWSDPSTEFVRNPLWDRYVEMLAYENGLEVPEAKRILKAARDRNFKRVHAEIPRIFKNHPTDMWIDRAGMGGKVSRELIPLLNTHPYSYAGSVTVSSAYRSSFVQEFGQSLTDTRLAEAMDEAVQAKITPTDVDRMMRALSGMEQSTAVTAPDAPERDLGNWFSYLMKFPRALMLTRASVPNTFEPLGNIQAFGGGPLRFIRAMSTLGPRSYTDLQQSFAREGLVQTWVMHATMDKQRPLHQSVPRIFREYVLRAFPTIQAWKLQEMQAAAMGVALADDVRTGRSTGLVRASDRFAIQHKLNFTEDETNAIMSGTAPDEQYVEIARRFASRSNTTMLSLPAEESRGASTEWWNEWFPFHRYSMMKVRSFVEAHTGLIEETQRYKADPSRENLTRLAGGMRTVALYHGGTATAGSMTYLLLALLAGGPAGLLVALRDLKEEPMEFVAKGWLSAQMGPVWTSLSRIWADRRIDNVWMMSAPLSVGYEAISAIAGFGPYQFLSWSERANKVMGRFNPGPRAIMDLFTAAGLTEDDPERELATKRYWTWVRDNTPPEAQTTWIDAEAATRAFRGNMRRAYNEMRKKQTAETIAKAHEYIEIAVGAKEGDYASAARSIRSRRLLPNIKDEKMEEFKKYMGPELFAALETHDAILDKWASGFTGGGTGGRTGRSASPRTGRTGR